MPGDELPKTPPKSPEKLKPDDVGHITHKTKKLEVKEPVSVYVSACVSAWLYIIHIQIFGVYFNVELL